MSDLNIKEQNRLVRVVLTIVLVFVCVAIVYRCICFPVLHVSERVVRLSKGTDQGRVVLYNHGLGELRIEKVAASCACVSVRLSTEVIPPRSSIELVAELRGNSQAQIALETNDPYCRHALIELRR